MERVFGRRSSVFVRVLLSSALLGVCTFAQAEQSDRVAITLDTSEVEQSLVVLKKEANHQIVTAEDWSSLFATAPYKWLKDREKSIGRPFTDASFQAFLASPEALAQMPEWIQAIEDVKRADLSMIGTNDLAWLPRGASIRARVFPEIKPLPNSFVWAEPGSSPAIFLSLQKQSTAQFENTVAHECHHIGLASLQSQQDALEEGLSVEQKSAFEWLGGFGEGEAMLAAAGSVDRHPHWEDDAVARARWDSDMDSFNTDLQSVQQFIADILDGKLKTQDNMQKRAAPFWGYQGAWYTVGYEMAVLVERRFGRKTLMDCLLDPRLLIVKYNEVAQEANQQGAHLATWSPSLIARLGLTSSGN